MRGQAYVSPPDTSTAENDFNTHAEQGFSLPGVLLRIACTRDAVQKNCSLLPACPA
jgi:hypothetical protein